MKRNEFIKNQKDLQEKLGRWRLETENEVFSDFTIGCFYDLIDNKWKIYVNSEKGRHRIRLMTDNEEEAFDELLTIVNFEIENNKYA